MTPRSNVELRLPSACESQLELIQDHILRHSPTSKSLASVLGVPQRWHVSLASFEGADPNDVAELMRSRLTGDAVEINW